MGEASGEQQEVDWPMLNAPIRGEIELARSDQTREIADLWMKRGCALCKCDSVQGQQQRDEGSRCTALAEIIHKVDLALHTHVW